MCVYMVMNVHVEMCVYIKAWGTIRCHFSGTVLLIEAGSLAILEVTARLADQ